MKKLFVLGLLFIFLFACEEKDQDFAPDDMGVITDEINAGKSSVPTSCQPMSGSQKFSKNGSYNCHQYVKGALVAEQVDLTTGNPQGNNFTIGHTSATIQADNNFIRVCNLSDAEATAVLPSFHDHSALILNNGSYTYSTPGAGHIYSSGSALNYSTACDYEYFASIEDVQISGPVVNNGEYTFTMTNLGSHSYIISDQYRWGFFSSAFTVENRSSSSITLKPKNGHSGNFGLTAVLNTTATDGPTGTCATGVNGYQTASTYTPSRSVTFNVPPPPPSCEGELDGNALYTWNSVSKYVTHNVVMDNSGWSWTKTSGSCSWSTSGSGKYMNFSIYSGSVTFQASKAGCSTKTITFTSY